MKTKLDSPVRHDAGRYLLGGRLATGTATVDRNGGDNKAGVIRGLSLITRGEALGHGAWVDAEAVEAVVGYAMSGKMKARFAHPSFSEDGTGKLLGRYRNARVEGNKAVADLHFSHSAHRTPDGDLANYVMDLVDDDADLVGLSIAFRHDLDEELAHEAEHTNEDGEFVSPDPDNEQNYPHVRFAEVTAADLVDQPAANPEGLFHRIKEPIVAFQVLDYAAGLTDDKPLILSSVDGERIRGLYRRWAKEKKLSTEASGDNTPDDPKPTETETNPAPDDTTNPKPAESKPEDTDTDVEPTEADPVKSELRSELSRYIARFGQEKGTADWIANKPYATAIEEYATALETERDQLKADLSEAKSQLASVQLGESQPIKTGSAKQKVVRKAGSE